jgi:tetratricopeptide (TPR) repeat protein
VNLRAHSLAQLANTFRQLSRLSQARQDCAGEAELYYRRACLAAREERFDVALVFCGKALELDPRHLATRLLVARIQDRGLNDFGAAVNAYRKVIALSGYDGSNPFCAAARQALDLLVANRTHEAEARA